MKTFTQMIFEGILTSVIDEEYSYSMEVVIRDLHTRISAVTEVVVSSNAAISL